MKNSHESLTMMAGAFSYPFYLDHITHTITPHLSSCSYIPHTEQLGFQVGLPMRCRTSWMFHIRTYHYFSLNRVLVQLVGCSRCTNFHKCLGYIHNSCQHSSSKALNGPSNNVNIQHTNNAQYSLQPCKLNNPIELLPLLPTKPYPRENTCPPTWSE